MFPVYRRGETNMFENHRAKHLEVNQFGPTYDADVKSTSNPSGIRFTLGTRTLGSDPTYFWSKQTERILRSESRYLMSGCSQTCFGNIVWTVRHSVSNIRT